MRSTARRLIVVAMAMAMVVALPGVALAHHPDITAEADCMLANGDWYLDYTATAWTDAVNDDQRTNINIGIYVNNVLQESDAFNPGNGFEFSGRLLISGSVGSVVVKAVANAQWGAAQNLGSLGTYSETASILKPTELCFEPPGTGTPGYWHKLDRWTDRGIGGIWIGGLWYTAQAAIDIINMPVKGDKTLTMFPALAAAKLNVYIGNPSFCIAATIDAADAWMTAYGPGSKVKANSSAWDVGGPLASMLDDYNNGRLCAPHRD